MKIDGIRRVLILGAGTMGQQIGFICALHGYEVMFYDVSQEILDESMARIKKLARFFVSAGHITENRIEDIFGRISISTDPAEAASGADIMSESVPEDPALKAKIFGEFNLLCPEHTIFTTNTSMLVPSLFAQATGRPEKFAALHFHDIRSTNVVDIMPHSGTSEETTKLIQAFARSIGQTAIMLHKENSGYVFNTMLSSLFFSALSLASKGVASVEDIDRAWMGVLHTPMGPFGLMDQVGLKTVWSITEYWAKKGGDRRAQANADFLKQYVDKRHLGLKTKQGFYSYPEPAYGKPDFLD